MWRFRTDQDEILDREGLSPRGRAILEDLDRWNDRVGWTRFHVRSVEAHWVALGEPKPLRLLDVGTGHGGLLAAISDHFTGRGVPVDLRGVDLHEGYVALARERLGDRARIVQGDATALGAPDGHWHIATCALMMHHLPIPVREALVAELARVARSVYLFDLECAVHWALGAAVVLPLAGLRRDTILDGLTSIRRAATFAEFRALAAPLPGRVRRVFPTAMAVLPVTTPRG